MTTPAWTTTVEAKSAFLHSLYRRLIDDAPRFITVSYLRSISDLDISNQFSDVIVQSLVDDGLAVHGDSSPDQKGSVSISTAGIDFVQSGNEFSEYPELDQQTWKNDDPSPLTVQGVEKVVFHLGQCVTLINGSSFSQEDKAQIIGLLKICQQIIELPNPKIGLLKKLLGWLKELRELTPLIELILKLVGKI